MITQTGTYRLLITNAREATITTSLNIFFLDCFFVLFIGFYKIITHKKEKTMESKTKSDEGNFSS